MLGNKDWSQGSAIKKVLMFKAVGNITNYCYALGNSESSVALIGVL